MKYRCQWAEGATGVKVGISGEFWGLWLFFGGVWMSRIARIAVL